MPADTAFTDPATDTPPSAATGEAARGPLHGLKVLDLSRILAGPTCTQILGDLGAEVIKVERPGKGDDTRGWGPPFLSDRDGHETAESAYYLSSNRNKLSLAVDLARPEGQKILQALATQSDILIENFKVGDLKRRGLDYDTLKELNPGLIYCSISGFGQTGPYAHRAGYDFLIQGMGGIMSLTGLPDDEGGTPMKAGVGIADVMCGMYAITGILAALHERQTSGLGQYVDVALLDTQVSWLINQGVAYLVSGQVPGRLGNGHPTIVPYETFPASDRDFILAVGNDAQFARFCACAECSELVDDPRFATNAARVRHRKELIPLLRPLTARRPAADWIRDLEALGVPCGPVNDLEQVFKDPQVQARGMRITMPHPVSGSVDLIGSPLNLSRTPVTYRRPPPRLGEGTETVLDRLGLAPEDLDRLERDGVISRDPARPEHDSPRKDCSAQEEEMPS